MSRYMTQLANLNGKLLEVLEGIGITDAATLKRFVTDVGAVGESFDLLTEGQPEAEGWRGSFIKLVEYSASDSLEGAGTDCLCYPWRRYHSGRGTRRVPTKEQVHL